MPQLCLRNQDDSALLWTLTGVAIRIAQLMDLPWDGSRFKLPPFETEMRRRLWWTLCSIESRYAEENGFQPASTGQWSETNFPLNVDDEDLHPEATEPPQPRLGCTDMTFSLINFEIVSLISHINRVQPQGAGNGDKEGSDMDNIVQKKVNMLDECRVRLETKYLQYCSSSRPFDWMTIFFARLLLVSALTVSLFGTLTLIGTGESAPHHLSSFRRPRHSTSDSKTERRGFPRIHRSYGVLSRTED